MSMSKHSSLEHNPKLNINVLSSFVYTIKILNYARIIRMHCVLLHFSVVRPHIVF